MNADWWYEAFEPVPYEGGPKGKVWTHPVVLNGRLYLRDQDLIFCYDVRP